MSNKSKKKKDKSTPSFIHWLEFSIIRLISACLSILPYRLALYFGSLTGLFLHTFIPIRLKQIKENLKIAFPEKDDQWYNQIAKNCYRQMGMSFVDFLCMGKLAKLARENKTFKLNYLDKENLMELDPKHKPFIGCGCHLSGWEQVCLICIIEEIPIVPLAKRIHNPFFNDWIEQQRLKTGGEVCYIEDVRNGLKKVQRNGGGLIFINDQDARHTGMFIDFFGKPCSTFTGPARMSAKFNIPFIPFFQFRNEDPTQITLILKPAKLAPKDLSLEEKIRYLLEYWTKSMEEVIREHPEQYFWFHKRWKTQPKKK